MIFCRPRNFASSKNFWCSINRLIIKPKFNQRIIMAQHPFHVKTQLHEADLKGGLSIHSPQCIAYKLPKKTVTSMLNDVDKKYPKDVNEASVYTASVDWIQSLSNSI